MLYVRVLQVPFIEPTQPTLEGSEAIFEQEPTVAVESVRGRAPSLRLVATLP